MTDGLNRGASYCPTCGAEYRAGFDTCADDQTRLIPGPLPHDFETGEVRGEAERPVPTTGARWVLLGKLPTEEEARLLAGRLEADGIPARVYPESIGMYYGSAIEAALRHGIDVLVPEDRLLEARQSFEELERS